MNFVSFAQAQASASFALLPDGFTFSATAAGSSSSQNPALQPPNVDGSASATIMDTIYLPGPVRPGFVELTCGGFSCFQSEDGGAGGGAAFITLGSLTCEGFENQLFCGGLRPIELGGSFQFSATVEADGPGCALCDDGAGAADLYGAKVTFYEADGVTPVTVYDEVDPPAATSEPATSLLIAIGLLALLTRRRFASRYTEISTFVSS
jgi:hypothetical protein